MLIINKPEIIEFNERSRLICNINQDGDEKQVWFEVDNEYAQYLCYERADAFLVGLLSYAMRNNHNIKCLAPVTEELLYNINTDLIPSLVKNQQLFHTKIEADCATFPILKKGDGVGTGLSCGIDSFHAVANHYNSNYPNHKLTHLCINSVGSFDGYKQAGMNRIKDFCYSRAAKVAKHLNIPLIATDSNFRQEFEQRHILTHAFSSMFAVLSLRKLWKVYFYASTYEYSHFSLSKTKDKDCSYYELLSLNCFSTPDLRIYSEGGAKDRLEKTKIVADFKPARKYLHVCLREAHNCGICKKCKRTLLALAAINKLDKFKDSFNIKYFKKNKETYFEWLCLQRRLGEKGDAFSEATYQHLLNTKYGEEVKKIDQSLDYTYLYKQVCSLKTERDKWKKSAQFLKSFISGDMKNNVFSFINERNYQNIAFYGENQITKALTSLFKDSQVKVKYIVENNKKSDSIQYFPKNITKYPPVDAIFITGVKSSLIMDKLKILVNFPIHIIEELLENISE